MLAQETELAYTYAWWLTGEEHAAEAAVRAAAGRVPAANGEHLPALLAGVRAAAIAARTMCPASEVALLHDGHGLPLDQAAGVAVVDLSDARTELAHGRLEALHETPTGPFEHPERLGGLAVGNPADVAHARQCDGCGRAQDLLTRGREELRSLPRPPLPEALLAPQPAPDEAAENRRWRVVAGVSLGLLLVLVSVWAAVAGPREAADEPAARPEPALPVEPGVPAPIVEPDAPAEPDDSAFRVTDARLVTEAGHPRAGDVVGPHEPMRLAVRYEGAAAGVVLAARWTVAGDLYRDLRVVLSGRRSTHVFGGPAPEEGWPPGPHQVVLAVDGEIVGAVGFTVPG
jgi:hypothetical protein